MEGEIYRLYFRGAPPILVVIYTADYMKFSISEKRKRIMSDYESIMDSSHLIQRCEFVKRVKLK